MVRTSLPSSFAQPTVHCPRSSLTALLQCLVPFHIYPLSSCLKPSNTSAASQRRAPQPQEILYYHAQARSRATLSIGKLPPLPNPPKERAFWYTVVAPEYVALDPMVLMSTLLDEKSETDMWKVQGKGKAREGCRSAYAWKGSRATG